MRRTLEAAGERTWSIQARLLFSFFRTLAGTQTKMPAEMAFNIIGPEIAAARTTWLMAIGPGIREGVIYDRVVESVDLVPTLGAMLGFSPSFAQGKPISELV